MTPSAFEEEVVRRFPSLTDDVAENRGLLHVVMGDLYRYTQEQLSVGGWNEIERVFRLLDEAYNGSKPGIEIENAIRVSFLEYFEFQGHETQVRQFLGPSLTQLYDDQMNYMEELARRVSDKSAPTNPDQGGK